MAELAARYGSRARTLLGESGQIVDGEVQLAAPSVPAQASLPVGEPRSGTASNAARVVAGMRAGFRNCYNRGLARHRWLEGTVRLGMTVNSTGQVHRAVATSVGFPDEVLDCILRRAGAGGFEPPEGGSAVIAVPIRFVRQ